MRARAQAAREDAIGRNTRGHELIAIGRPQIEMQRAIARRMNQRATSAGRGRHAGTRRRATRPLRSHPARCWDRSRRSRLPAWLPNSLVSIARWPPTRPAHRCLATRREWRRPLRLLGSARRIGTQSATITARTRPGSFDTMASPSGRSRLGSRRGLAALQHAHELPCTCFTRITCSGAAPNDAAPPPTRHRWHVTAVAAM